MDKLEFLDGADAPNEDVQPVEPQPEPVQPATEAPAEPAPSPEQPRNDKGQFAAKAQEAAPQVEQAVPSGMPEPKADPIMVPLAALHETRDKLKDVEGRLARYEQSNQPQPQPVQVPDAYEDPEGFQAFQNKQIEAARYQDRLFFSERLAVMQHGQDAFEKARDWGVRKCDEDPHFNARVRMSQDPYSVVMAEYQRDQIASQVSPSEFEAFLAWKTAQGQLQTQQQQAAPVAVPETPVPPPSIASSPSAGGIQHVAIGPGVAFADTIK